MKLAMIISDFKKNQNASSIRMNSFIDEWKEKKVDLTIYPFEKKKVYNKNEVGDLNVKWGYIDKPNNKENIILRAIKELMFSIIIFFRLMFAKDEIYFVSSPSYFLLIVTYFSSKLRGKKLVIDIRDLYPEVLFEKNIIKRTSILGKRLEKLEKKIYEYSSVITVVTNGLKKEIENKIDKKDKVFYSPNGVEGEKFKKIIYGKEYSKFIVLFHGTIGQFQEISVFINLAKKIKEEKNDNVIIRIIGDGSKKDKLIELIKREKVSDVIEYLGKKNYSEIPKFINEAHIGLSSRVSGKISETSFPVKIYEYLACGLPVISTPISEAGKFVRENGVGLESTNENIDKIYTYIEMLRNNKSIYNEKSQKAESLKKLFLREEIAKKVLEKYMEIERR